MRPQRGHAGAHRPTERISDEFRPFEPCLRNERPDVRGRVAEHESLASSRAEPRQIDEIHLQTRRKLRNDRVPPAPGTGEAVHEHGRRPATCDAVAHLDAAYLGRPFL